MKKTFLVFVLFITFLATSLIYATTYTIGWNGYCGFYGQNPLTFKVDEDFDGNIDHFFFFPPNDIGFANRIKACLENGHDVGIWFHVSGGLKYIEDIECWDD